MGRFPVSTSKEGHGGSCATQPAKAHIAIARDISCLYRPRVAAASTGVGVAGQTGAPCAHHPCVTWPQVTHTYACVCAYAAGSHLISGNARSARGWAPTAAPGRRMWACPLSLAPRLPADHCLAAGIPIPHAESRSRQCNPCNVFASFGTHQSDWGMRSTAAEEGWGNSGERVGLGARVGVGCGGMSNESAGRSTAAVAQRSQAMRTWP